MRSSVFGAKGGRYSVSRRGTRNSWILVTVGRKWGGRGQFTPTGQEVAY